VLTLPQRCALLTISGLACETKAFVKRSWRNLYCASHKNWIRIIRFIGMHRPLSQ